MEFLQTSSASSANSSSSPLRLFMKKKFWPDRGVPDERYYGSVVSGHHPNSDAGSSTDRVVGDWLWANHHPHSDSASDEEGWDGSEEEPASSFRGALLRLCWLSPGYQRLTSATKAAAITTVATKKEQEFESKLGGDHQGRAEVSIRLAEVVRRSATLFSLQVGSTTLTNQQLQGLTSDQHYLLLCERCSDSWCTVATLYWFNAPGPSIRQLDAGFWATVCSCTAPTTVLG